jgi:hydrogenase nickel incorporation protein HypA/HybF
MHEMGLAQEMIDILLGVMKDHSGKRLKTVYVDVGELVAVVPDSLQMAYQMLTADGPLQQSVLQINVLPVRSECRTCQKEFDVHSFQFCCPDCQSTQLHILSGEEFKISAVEIE